MKLTSTVFADNGEIPSEHTCDGDDTVPPLVVSDVPKNARSLVLLMDDPDIPDFVRKKFNITMWDHWVLFNIDPRTTTITEDSGVNGRNTRGKNAYAGPCPPDREHRYYFKLYALDTLLNLPEGSTKKQLQDVMEGHVVAEARLMGRYTRSGS